MAKARVAALLKPRRKRTEPLHRRGPVAAVWDAETTQDRDRKELTRLMVKVVIIEERTR